MTNWVNVQAKSISILRILHCVCVHLFIFIFYLFFSLFIRMAMWLWLWLWSRFPHQRRKEKRITHTDVRAQRENFAVIQFLIFLISHFCVRRVNGKKLFMKSNQPETQRAAVRSRQTYYKPTLVPFKLQSITITKINEKNFKYGFLIKLKSLAHLLPHSTIYFDCFV